MGQSSSSGATPQQYADLQFWQEKTDDPQRFATEMRNLLHSAVNDPAKYRDGLRVAAEVIPQIIGECSDTDTLANAVKSAESAVAARSGSPQQKR